MGSTTSDTLPRFIAFDRLGLPHQESEDPPGAVGGLRAARPPRPWGRGAHTACRFYRDGQAEPSPECPRAAGDRRRDPVRRGSRRWPRRAGPAPCGGVWNAPASAGAWRSPLVRDWQLVVAALLCQAGGRGRPDRLRLHQLRAAGRPSGRPDKASRTNPFAYGLPRPDTTRRWSSTSPDRELDADVRVAAQGARRSPEGISRPGGAAVHRPGSLLEGGLLAPPATRMRCTRASALALFVDALAGVLTGAGLAQEGRRRAWEPPVRPRCRVAPSSDEFRDRTDAQLDQIKQGERLPGVDELLVPGERGQRRYLDLTARGWYRWRRRVGSSWRRAASRWPSRCPPSWNGERGGHKIRTPWRAPDSQGACTHDSEARTAPQAARHRRGSDGDLAVLEVEPMPTAAAISA